MDNTNRLKSNLLGFALFLTFRFNLIKQYLKSVNIKQILRTTFTLERLFLILLATVLYALHLFLYNFNKILGYYFLYESISFLIMALPNRRPFKKIKFLVSALHSIGLLLDPIIRLSLAITSFFATPLALSLLLFHVIPELIFQIDLTLEVKIYLIATFSSIFMVLFGESAANIIKVDDYKPKERRKKQIEFVLSVINHDVIKYIIYLSFFISLLFFSFVQLNDMNLFGEKNIGIPILQAFGTFIAFDRLVQNKNLMNINLKRTFKKLLIVWETYT